MNSLPRRLTRVISSAFIATATPLLIGLVVPFCALAGEAPAGIPLVTDGHSDYVVVTAKGASPSEKWAAEQFVEHVKLMSGATLKIAPAGEAPARAVIIGDGEAARAAGVRIDAAALGDDGFVIRTVATQLVVAGGRRRGTMYGVFAVLEELGCRWWYPGETTIPKTRTIVLPAMNRREVPRLEFRDAMFGECHSPDGQMWNARNRMNGMSWGKAPEEWGGEYVVAGLRAHDTVELAQQSTPEMKPEMWALVDGKRTQAEICSTNPDVIAATVRSLVAVYKEHPGTQYVVLSHEDNDSYCRCERCAAISEREGSPSGQHFHYINAIAEALEKEVPGARIMTSAYGWTRTPPKTIRPRGNVIIRFAPIETDYAHPLVDAGNPENKKVVEDLAVWGKKASGLFIWTYIGNRAHYLMPNPDLDSIAPNIKLFADNGATGIMQQGTHVGRGTEFIPLRMWLLGKLLWNPNADGKALINEFLDGFYGPAAPAVRDYIDVMHAWGRKNNYHLGRVTRMNAPFLQPETIAEAEEVLRKADRAAAGDPTLERRVRHAHMPIWYVLVKRGPDSPTWKAVEKRVGKLDFAVLARNLNQVAKDYKISAVADPEQAAPFFEWLTDYAGLLAERGRVVPPELKDADPRTYRLLQARQIDSGWLGRDWWRKMPNASDGWALMCPSNRWLIQHHLSPWDEYEVGRTYRLFVRVKGGEKKKDGMAFACGVGNTNKEFPVDALADGRFHVLEVGEVKAEEQLRIWFALSKQMAMSEVFLDCLWLVPQPD